MNNICGFWKFRTERKDLLTDSFVKMAQTDASINSKKASFWMNEPNGIVLGYGRLSPEAEIVQPKQSSCSRYVLAYEGEIYNLKEIQEELMPCSNAAGAPYGAKKDADIMIDAISKWGLEETLKKLNGVFVFALWDKHENKLFIARDRIGVKNFYYGIQNNILFFSSTIGSICSNDLFFTDIDRNVLALFFRYNCVPAPYSIYKDIKKLKQGFFAVINGDMGITEHCYWDALAVVKDGALNPIQKAPREIADELEEMLLDSVGRRLPAGASGGVFLSGGIDSSLIASLAQTQRDVPIQTFNIGLDQERYDETIFAEAIARHLGTKHTVFNIMPRHILNTVQQMPKVYDEPFSDSSQIPTFLLFQFARQYITAGLSGDGGDEVFGGYNRYLWADTVWNFFKAWPGFMKKMCAGAIQGVSPERLDGLSRRYSSLCPKFLNHRLFGDKLHKAAEAMKSSSPDDLYFRLTSHWQNPEELVFDSREPDTITRESKVPGSVPNFIDRMMYFDLMTYLPDDGLVKVVKVSEAMELSARAPILDHRIVEFSKRLPLSVKIRGGKSKWILRQILHKYVPEKLLERPKMGFGVPIDTWLRGPLRGWAEELLDEREIRKDMLLNPKPIKKLWSEHLTGKKNNSYHLWDILMFQAWKKEWM